MCVCIYIYIYIYIYVALTVIKTVRGGWASDTSITYFYFHLLCYCFYNIVTFLPLFVVQNMSKPPSTETLYIPIRDLTVLYLLFKQHNVNATPRYVSGLVEYCFYLGQRAAARVTCTTRGNSRARSRAGAQSISILSLDSNLGCSCSPWTSKWH